MSVSKGGDFPLLKGKSSILLLLTLCGCTVVNFSHYKPEKVYKHQDVSLRLDGYYYYVSSDLIFPTFLYSDGSSLSMGGFPSEMELTNYLTNKLSEEELKKYKGRGGFYIEGNKIIIQTLEALSSGGIPVSVGVREERGVILSDTSYLIKQSLIPQQRKQWTVNILHIFREYSFKPDSTNWVKEKYAKRQ